MNEFNEMVLRLAGVNIPTYEISDVRSKKLVLALSYFLYVSSFLCGFAMYTAVKFLVGNILVAFIIGLSVMLMMVWHDQSLMATSKTYQVVLKLLFSLFLAVSFTITSNTEKYADVLRMDIVQSDKQYNAKVRSEMNSKLDQIDLEERSIMYRIEEASKFYDETGKNQRLIDARRSLEAFSKTKEDRKQRIKDSYKDKFLSTEVSQSDLLIMQAKKMLDGEEGTFVAIILSFLFFMLEALPVLIALLLTGSDYSKRHHSDLKAVEDLRDQSITSRHNFIAPGGDIIKELFTIDIIEEKRRLILDNFNDKDAMRVLAYRKKLLDNGFDPYTGKPIDEINFSILFEDVQDQEPSEADSKTQDTESENAKNNQHQEEPIFEF